MLETSTAPDSVRSRVETAPRLGGTEVLTFEPPQLTAQLISRRQQLARIAGQGGDTATLVSEVDVLCQRGRHLRGDAYSPNLNDVGTRIKDVERRLSEGGLSSNEQMGLRIRLRLLTERRDWLHSNGPVIATRETSEWKAENVHNGAALPLDRWDYVSPKLVTDPDAELNDREECRRYIRSLDTRRRRDVAAISAQMEPIGDRVRAVVCMPAYKEGDNIRTTLQNFLGQKNLDGTPFDYSRTRIVVVDNWPEGGRRDKTGAEVRKLIAQAKRQHPDLQIDYVRAVMSGKGRTIGNIRNIAAAGIIDSAKDRSKDAEDLIYVSHDADMPKGALRKDYLATVIDEFDTHPRMDAMAGKIDFPRDVMARTPVQFATRRLWQFSDIALMLRYNKEPFLVGRNSALRLKMLAAVGNYDSRDRTGEDVEIGNKVKWARSWVPERRKFDRRNIRAGNSADNRVRHSNRAVLITDPRRDLIGLIGGTAIRNQYSRFESDQSVRGKSGAELAEVAVQRGHGVFDKGKFEREAAAFYYHARNHAAYGSLNDFRRAMRLLGAKWTERDGKFVVTDTAILERGIQKAQREEGVAVSERNAIPYDIGKLEAALGSRVRSAERVTIGQNNAVFRARMDDGRDVFIRVGRITARDKFGAESWAFSKLRGRGVPVPEILVTDNSGSTISNKSLSVSLTMEGMPLPSYNRQRMRNVGRTFFRQAGRALRKIHSVSTDKYGYIDEKGSGHAQSWGEFVMDRIDSSTLNALSMTGLFSQGDLGRIVRYIQDHSGLLGMVQPHLLHGDFSLNNMLAKDRNVAGVLDMENAISGDPIWDIARFAVFHDEPTVDRDLHQLLLGYGDTKLLESPENRAKYNIYRLVNILNTMQWYQSRGEGTLGQNRTFINKALRKVLKDI